MSKTPNIDRKVELKLIEFVNGLKRDMSQKEIAKLYEEIEAEHWVSESKVLIMRTIFHAVLSQHDVAETASPFGYSSSSQGEVPAGFA